MTFEHLTDAELAVKLREEARTWLERMGVKLDITVHGDRFLAMTEAANRLERQAEMLRHFPRTVDGVVPNTKPPLDWPVCDWESSVDEWSS